MVRWLAVTLLSFVAACGASDADRKNQRGPAVAVSSHALSADLPGHAAQALTWLSSRQNGDGRYGARPESLATPFQATAEVLLAQQAWQETAGVDYANALSALNAEPEETAETLARRISVNAGTAQSTGAWANALLAREDGRDGGFGGQPGEDASVIDTALAVEALSATPHASGEAVAYAVSFLLSEQLAGGAWAHGASELSVFLTGTCIKALLPFRSRYAGVSAALSNAEGYLLAQRGADGLWGEDFASAMALLALSSSMADVSVLESTEAALRARQAENGSWQSDELTTALVLRALRAFEARNTPTSPLTASIAGSVHKAQSTEPIGSATVRLLELPELSVLTNEEGHFLLPTVAPGTYTLTAHKAGYTSASTTVVAVSGQVTVAAPLVLDLETTSGMVRGLVFDNATQAPLASVQVTLTGATTLTRMTAADGSFDFGPVAPGPYTLEFAKEGYRTIAGTANVLPGQTLVAQLGMTLGGGFADSEPGTVSGRIVDGTTGLPIGGAGIELAAGLTATSSADGSFEVPAVPRGTYQGSVALLGYRTLTFTLVYPAGASGDLGTLSLFQESPSVPPTTLTLRGVVVDGVSGAPISQAAISLVETGDGTVTGADGRFELSDLTIRSFHLEVSASGYSLASYAIDVSAFGEANVTLRLSPPGDGATATTLSGIVTNAVTLAPLPGAVVSITGTPISTTTDATGHYTLSGIDLLQFTFEVAAVGFRPVTGGVTLVQHGRHQLDFTLEPVPADSFQVVSVSPEQPSWPGNATALFTARIASLLTEAKSALVVGEVQDVTGAPIANVLPYAEGTTDPIAELDFAPGAERELTVPWDTLQFPPGSYRLVVRVVEPGTITRSNPQGEVLAEGAAQTSVVATTGIGGALAIDPPITQAGLPTEVVVTALLRNAGNVPLGATTLMLEVSQPDGASPLFSTSAPAPALAAGANVSIPFPGWVPTEPGDLIVRVFAADASIPGELLGRLHVGDKATGAFTVEPAIVSDGTQSVRGKIDLRGVDVTIGSSTDPLFALVKESVRRGAVYTGPAAMTWHRTNRCLGCHIQTQSLLGLTFAMDKAEVDPKSVQFLYNAVSTSQWADGALRISHPEFTGTQTTLGLWSLAPGSEAPHSLRAKLAAAKLLLARKIRSGEQTRWQPDHATGWWDTAASHTALTVKGFSEVLRAASELDLTTIPDYAVSPQFALGAGSAVEDMAFGPGGELFALRASAVVSKIDVATGAVSAFATGLPSGLTGMGFAPDGTLYLTRSASPNLIKIAPDGTRQNLALGGSLADVAVGPDGWVYYSDISSNRIQRRNDAGQVETFVAGGLLNRPMGLDFDGDDLIVANQRGYNLLRITPERAVSIFSDGLAYEPNRLAAAPGQPYFVTTNNGPLRVARDGRADRVLQNIALAAVAVAPTGEVFFSHDSTHFVQSLQVGSLATADFSPLLDEIPYAVRYLLATYQDNSSDNTAHALRIWGLSEAREHITDASMRASMDAAIAFETNLLRNRQRADGSWGRFASSGSDPLTTAMVGIALEYTNPSADDPQIRKTIQYLLNTQGADGSWHNTSNGLTTRLASTSFVMIFMPKALERLGGIDLDLHLDVPSNIELSSFTVQPSEVTPGDGGATSYLWRLLGVTGSGQRIDFDVTLFDMELHETRSVADSAYLEFDNSFLPERLTVPLDVPTVRADSELDLAVSTDKTVYLSDQSVLITSTVQNTGPTPAGGALELFIRPNGSDDPVAALPAIPFDPIAPGQQLVLSSSWDTESTLAGPYEVYGRVIDSQGRNATEAFAPFRIDKPLAVAASAVTTDRPVYEAWDVVSITGRVRNLATNAFMDPTRVELTVHTPSGEVLLYETRNVGELAPRGLVDLSFVAQLVDAEEGEYPVTLVLQDAFTREHLDTSTTSFLVERETISAIVGEESVDAPSVFIGDPNRCVATAQNIAMDSAATVTLTHLLVWPEQGVILDEVTEVVDLVGGAQGHVYVRDIDTSGLAPGGYSCILLAEVDGVERTLDTAGFQVVEPPIHVAATLTASGPGRLLILVDPLGGDDPLGPEQAPTLAEQRAALEEVLTQAGWSYTIVESAEAFTAGLYSGAYSLYAIFAETEKLSTEAQQLLGEAVFRGEGLLFAGDHDSRDYHVHEALGVKYIGKHSKALAVVPVGDVPPLADTVAVLLDEKPLRGESSGAAILGEYQVSAGATSPAITLHSYGLGRAAWMGADLAALIARDGADSVAAHGLLTLLQLAHPVSLSTGVLGTLPIELRVQNEGSATEVSAFVELPPGSSVVDPGTGVVDGQTISFTFPLAVDELVTSSFWLRLPETPGAMTLFATVDAGGETFVFTTMVELPLVVTGSSSLQAVSEELAILAASIPAANHALNKAKSSVDRAIEQPAQAIKHVLMAVDALSGQTDPRIVDARVELDLWLRATLAVSP